MSTERFYIVIPTRNRHDTLQHAIRTCLAQADRNLEIIISDNFSSPDTASTVEAFSDPRLRYQRSARPLCMMDSWEFGLSGVNGSGFVHFMGDDNGLMPDAIGRVREVVDRAQVQVVHGKPIQYVWPDGNGRGGLLQIPAPGPDIVAKSATVLRHVFGLRVGFDRAPTINACFVHTDVIAKARSLGAGGKYFRASNPDVYSAMVNAYCTERFAYLNRAFFVNGASPYSNGRSAQSGGVSRFVQDNLDSGYRYHKGFPPSASYFFNVYEALAQAAELFDPSRKLKLNYEKILKRAIRQEYRAMGRHWLYDDLVRFAKIHNLDVNIPHLDPDACAFAGPAGSKDDFQVTSASARLDNVYDAAVLAETVFASRENCFPRAPFAQRVKDFIRERFLMGGSAI